MTRDLAVATAFLRHQYRVTAQRRMLLATLDALAVHLVDWSWPGFAQAAGGTGDANLETARTFYDAWRASTYSRVLDQRAAVEAAIDAGIRRNYADQMAWCQGVLRALPPLGGPQ
jgi:hypothetical protein